MASWLTTTGAAVVDEVTAALDRGESELAVGTRLRERLDPDQAAAAVAAATARRRARTDGIPGADRLLLTRSAREQASRPEVSAHRARRFAGAGTVVDLCAGAGLDTIALGREVADVVAIDLDTSRARLLDHNTAASGVDVSVVVGDALRPPVRLEGLVHADPSRRRDGRRARRLADYGPPVPALLAATAAAPGRGVVLSPAVDRDDPALPDASEIEFVQVGPDLVEAMLWLGDLRVPGADATATLLPAGVSLSGPTRTGPLPVAPVGEWLLEMAPALVRARLHDHVGATVGAHRIARTRALLTTSTRPADSPWWKAWLVEAVLPARRRTVRAWLREAPELPLEVATHGLDADPTEWWRALGSPPRGPEGRRLHLVRTDEGAVCIATRTD